MKAPIHISPVTIRPAGRLIALLWIILTLMYTDASAQEYPELLNLDNNLNQEDCNEVLARLIQYDEEGKDSMAMQLIRTSKLTTSSHHAGGSCRITDVIRVIDQLGVHSRNNGNYPLALYFHRQALKLALRIHDLRSQCIIYNNIGVVNRRLDNYQEAITYHMKARLIADSINDDGSLAVAVNSLGNINVLIGNLNEAQELFMQSYELAIKMNNPLGVAINLNNMGNICEEKGEYEAAEEYYKKSLKENESMENNMGIGICYNDLGNLYLLKGNLEKGKEYLEEALIINSGTGDKNNMAYSYIKLGEVEFRLNKTNSAVKHLISGLRLAEEIRAKNNIAEAYQILYEVAKRQGKYREAMKYLELEHQYHDSILNLNIQKEVARLQINYESERQKAKIMVLEQETALASSELKRQKNVRLFLVLALILVLVLVIFLVFYNRVKNKHNRELIEKNKVIDQTRHELDQYSKELLEAKKEAEHSNQIKSEFLTNMSHEIRTPLNSVIGFSELLEQSVEDPKLRSYVLAINSSGKSLLMLINDMLDLSKIESGKVDLHYNNMDPTLIIEDMVQLFRPKVIQKNLQIQSHVSKLFPKKIFFSEIRLRQILFNLVGNAIKFTSEGQIDIFLDHTYNEGNHTIDMIIWVRDTGTGISRSNIEKIFDPFKQVGPQSDQGTGLGLTITKRLVNMLNGTISMESQPEKGSLFSLFFPDISVVEDMRDGLSTKANTTTHILFVSLMSEPSSPYFEAITETQHLSKEYYATTERDFTSLPACDVLIIHNSMMTNLDHIERMINLTAVHNKMAIIVIGPYKGVIRAVDVFSSVNSDCSVGDFKAILNETIDNLSLNNNVAQYFESEWHRNNPGHIAAGEALFRDYFLKARKTNLIPHIQEFSRQLMKLGSVTGDLGIMQYCRELDRKTLDFDTAGIELLLKTFDRHFRPPNNSSDKPIKS